MAKCEYSYVHRYCGGGDPITCSFTVHTYVCLSIVCVASSRNSVCYCLIPCLGQKGVCHADSGVHTNNLIYVCWLAIYRQSHMSSANRFCHGKSYTDYLFPWYEIKLKLAFLHQVYNISNYGKLISFLLMFLD